jgi:hypothetical protein
VPATGPTQSLSKVIGWLAREPFLLLVVSLDALIVSVLLPLLVRSDTWLALVGGRQIWKGGLPHHDTLTVWSHGATWVDQQWFGQLVFYGIHAAGGLRLVLLVHGIVLVSAFTLALTFAVRTGGSARSGGLVGIAALVAALPNSTVRTQAFAYVLFVGVFWLLASDARQRSRRVFLVLPLLVVWANVHGSAVLGAGLVILLAAAEIVSHGRQANAWNARGRALALAVAAPLCLLASPYAVGLPGYYHDVLGSSTFRDVVSEWHAATFPDQWPFFVLAVAALWLAGRGRAKLSLFEQLALVALFFAGLETLRSIVWFALVTAMVVPRALDGVWPAGPSMLRHRVNVGLGLGSLVVLVAAFAAAAAHPTRWYARDYPRSAVDAVSQVAGHDPSLRVFANEAYADWLLWNVPGLAGRVAFDARFELLSSAQLRSIAHFRNQSSPNWIQVARGYRLLVLDPDKERPAIRAVVRERGTKVLYRDSHVAVLLRGATS